MRLIEDTTNSDGDVDAIGGGTAVPRSDRVIWLDPTLTWEVRLGPNGAWGAAGTSGPLNMYFTWNTPLDLPVYDLALQKAVKDYCGTDGKTPEAEVCSAICTGLDGEIYYDPTRETYHDLNIYTPKRGQCCCHAAVFRLLIRSVGIDGSMVYIWGGCTSGTLDLYIFDGWAYGQSFMVNKSAHDGAPANPHFVFHVEVQAAGNYYDPSYGTSGLISLDETAPAHPPFPAASRQTGSSLPGSGSTHNVPWICPH